jgi:hypothetical protein
MFYYFLLLKFKVWIKLDILIHHLNLLILNLIIFFELNKRVYILELLILKLIVCKISLRILIKPLYLEILLIVCLLKYLLLLLVVLMNLRVENVGLLKIIIDFNCWLLKFIFARFDYVRVNLLIIFLIFHLIIN